MSKKRNSQKYLSHRSIYVECFRLHKVERGKINKIILGNMGLRLEEEHGIDKSKLCSTLGQSVHRASKGLMEVPFFSLMADMWMLDLLFFKQKVKIIYISFQVEWVQYI